MKKRKIIIIGAGPAGLGCGYELINNKNKNLLDLKIVDKNENVGGLARSYYFDGHYFDIGPHRFYTKNKEILKLWKHILGKELISVDRFTRILYKNNLFQYPIQIKDVIFKLGIQESIHCITSFLKAKILLSKSDPKTFEEWITKNFGNKLYKVFFKTYTEKVWGIPCKEIGAEWAAQRIKNLNLFEIMRSAVLGNKKSSAKSLVNKFYYPLRGAGYLYQKMSDEILKKNGQLATSSSVIRICHKSNLIKSVTIKNDKGTIDHNIDYLFSSMPLTHFIFSLFPKPPIKILTAAKKLYYRDHITVNLVIDNPNLFPDNWIYIHSSEVKMARIANYNNFQNKKNKHSTAISVEYFTFKNDSIWKLSDDDLTKLAIKELKKVGLLKTNKITNSFVIRETESYPTYYINHKKHFDILKDYTENFLNLQLIGRGGLYKYNNMDHSLYSGILAAKNYLKGYKHYNIWNINEEAEYLEEKNIVKL